MKLLGRILSSFFGQSVRNWLLFLTIWFFTGFVTGTSVLMGPVRWMVNLSGYFMLGPETEDSLVKIVIVLFVISSFILCLYITRAFLQSKFRHIRWIILGTLFSLSIATLILWLTPGALNRGTEQRYSDDRFTFGNYPSGSAIETLSESGYTAVISLLHPAVVPFESILIEEERAALEEIGLQMIHLPMLPWVSENLEVLDSLRSIAALDSGRYYVHCYLGKDRVNAARSVIESVTGGGSSSRRSTRRLFDGDLLERGEVIELERDVYLTPYPTDEEFISFVVSGQIQTVVSIMDSNRASKREWINRERELVTGYNVSFVNLPVSIQPYSPENTLEVARQVRELSRPLIVHDFRTPSYESDAFLQAYRSDTPSIPPSLLERDAGQLDVEMIGPNVAIRTVSSLPRTDELRSLGDIGFSGFVWFGSMNNAQQTRYQRIFDRLDKNFEILTPPYTRESFNEFSSNGPWYFFGPGLDSLRTTLEWMYGPVFPEQVAVRVTSVLDEIPSSCSVEPPETTPETESNLIQDFIRRAMPDPSQAILLAPFLMLYTWFAAYFAGSVKLRGVYTGYTRKVFHFQIFLMASILQYFAGLSMVIVFGTIVSTAVLYAVWRGKPYPFYMSMARENDAPHESRFILIPLVTTAAGGVLTSFFFPAFSYIGFLVGGAGDAIGEPVGRRWGKHKYKVPSLFGVPATRSIEGSTGVLLVSFIFALFGLSTLGFPLLTSLYVAGAVALAAMLIEAVSHHGMDNLTIQAVSAGTAWALLTLL